MNNINTNYIQAGDSAKLLKELPSDYIDLTITSPPYDNIRDYKGYQFDFETIAQQLYRVTKWGGVLVWIVNDQTINGSESLTSFKQAIFLRECGFKLHDTMIWKKDTFSFPDKNKYYQTFEYMFVFVKGKLKTFNPIKDRKNKYAGTKIHGTYRNSNGETIKRNEKWCETICNDYGTRFNVWEQPTEKTNRSGHPAVFPLNLAKDHILSWSNENDIVLDPFIGSGTTALACIETNRKFIGFDISEDYCEIARKRIGEKVII